MKVRKGHIEYVPALLFLVVLGGASLNAGIVPLDKLPSQSQVDMKSVAKPSILIDLAGRWQTTSTGEEGVVRKGDLVQFPPPGKDAKWADIDIPGSTFQGPICWYRRTVEIPAEWAGKRMRLSFKRTVFTTDIFWNGRRVHTQIDPSYGYEVDVSDAVHPGQKNELLVGISDSPDPDVPSTRWLDNAFRGISGPVSLIVTDPLTVVDIFAKPSVSQKKLDLEVTIDYLKTKDSKPRRIVPTAWIEDDGKTVKRTEGNSVDILPGQRKVVTLSIPWSDAELWWPHRPYLYRVGVELREGGKSLGGKTVRFGFREFLIKKHLIFLNGKKLFLRRISTLWLDGPGSRQSLVQYRSWGYNSIRTHLAPNDSVYDATDEEGFIAFPEMKINMPWMAADLHSRAWRFCREQVEGVVRENRNHPSVLMWNIDNEATYTATAYFKSDLTVAQERLDLLGKIALKLDSTRTVHFEGDIDLGGRAPTANLHYPWQVFKLTEMLPTTIYWLDEKRPPWMGWIWQKDKPLNIGEDFFPPYSIRYPQGASEFAGDRAYVDPDGWIEAGLKALKWLQEGYAHAEVFCYNPWGHVLEKMYDKGAVVRPIILAVRQKGTTFFSGEKAQRTIYVYNHTSEDRNFILKIRLGDEANMVFTRDTPISLVGGEMAEFNVEIPLPKVSDKRKLQFVAKLFEKDKEITDGEESPWSIFPRLSPADWPKAKIIVVAQDPRGKQELRQTDMPFQVAKTVTTAISAQPDLILIYGETVSAADGESLMRYVSNGGRVIMTNIPNGSWLPGGAVIADGGNHYAAHAFFAVADHPLLEGMLAEDVQVWRPDSYVCRGTFAKPAGAALKTILDAGGPTGIQWSPLLELPVENGRFILNQMNILNRVAVEPAAGFLLKNMVHAALRPVLQTAGPVCSVTSEKSPLNIFLKTNGFIVDNPSKSKLVLVDGSQSANVLKERLAVVPKDKVTIFLHSLTPDSAAVVSSILGVPITLSTKSTGQLIRTGRDPIIDGLSNDDFFWMTGQLGLDEGWEPQPKITVPICETVLDLDKSPGWRALTKPAALSVYEKDHFRVVLDQIRWDRGQDQEKTKCLRIGTTLLANLGAKVSVLPSASSRTLAFVNLRTVVNRGFVDPVKSDGQGGWTDEGPEWDMRFFPVNLVGTDRKGLGCPKEKFPDRSTMGPCDFKLIDPETNQGKSCLVLGQGKGLTPKSPPIRIGQTVRAVWFLHTSEIGWGNRDPVDVARITITYRDKTIVSQALKNGIHLGDWREAPTTSQADFGWRGYCIHHDPVAVYAYRWENPKPQTPIQDLSITAQTGTYVLTGLTVEK